MNKKSRQSWVISQVGLSAQQQHFCKIKNTNITSKRTGKEHIVLPSEVLSSGLHHRYLLSKGKIREGSLSTSVLSVIGMVRKRRKAISILVNNFDKQTQLANELDVNFCCCLVPHHHIQTAT